MSNWAHIHGTIQLDVQGRTQHEKEYILRTVLDHLPVIAGSENDMDIYVIKKNGYTTGDNIDEFEEKTNNLVDRYGKKDREYGEMCLQSKYMLLVDGALRDRESKDVYRDFIKWLTRLSKRIEVEEVNVKIYDLWYYNKYLIIDEERKWAKLYVYSQNEVNWTNYLQWDYPKDENGKFAGYNPHRI